MKHPHHLLSKQTNDQPSNPKIGVKHFKSPHESPFPPTTQKQKQNDKPPSKPENTSKCTDEAPTPPTIQTKNAEPSDPQKLGINH